MDLAGVGSASALKSGEFPGTLPTTGGFLLRYKRWETPRVNASLPGSGVNASLLRLLLRLAPCQRCLCLSSCQGSTEQTSLSDGGVAYFDIADVTRIFSWGRIVSSQRVLCVIH